MQPTRLLIAQCGAKKLAELARADQLYQGPLWQSIRKHAPGRAQLAVLSAEHGLIGPGLLLRPYDRRLDRLRRTELAGPGWTEAALHTLEAAADEAGDRISDVCVVGGWDYVALAQHYLASARSQLADRGFGDFRLEVINDQIGLMRQRMTAWLHLAG